MRMIRTIVLVGSLCTAGHAFTADKVTIKAYTPEVGVERTYRLHRATETDLTFWRGTSSRRVIARGDFRQRLTVLAKEAQGLLMRWQLSADTPTESSVVHELNTMRRRALTTLGIRQLDFKTSIGGVPIELVSAENLLENLKRAAQRASAADADSLTIYFARSEKDPQLLINLLTPEAALLAMGQFNGDGKRDVGEQWDVERVEYIEGFDVPVVAHWKLEAIDARAGTVIFSVSEDFDPEAYTRSQRALTDFMLADLTKGTKPLSETRLAEAKQAYRLQRLQIVISLAEGATIEALETVATQIAGVRTITRSHLQREDQPMRLELPAILKRADAAALALSGGASAAFEIAAAQVSTNPLSLELSVEIAFTPESTTRFKDFTAAAVGKNAQLLADGQVVSELRINSPVSNGWLAIPAQSHKALQTVAEQLTPGASIVVRVLP